MTEIPDEELYNQADEIQRRLANKKELEKEDRRYMKEVMSNVKSKMGR